MANAYTMSGGRAVTGYSGSYNITPTISDITLPTNSAILEDNLVIQGGQDLYPEFIKYGQSIFNVSGKMVERIVSSNYGTVYRNGQYTGDEITDLDDVANVKYVGALKEATSDFTLSYDEYLVGYYKKTNISADNSFYYTTRHVTKKDLGNTELIYTVYDNGTTISTINVKDLLPTTPTYIQSIETSDDDDNVLVFITWQDGTYAYAGGLVIYASNGNYKFNIYIYQGDLDLIYTYQPRVRPCIIGSYVCAIFYTDAGTDTLWAVVAADKFSMKLKIHYKFIANYMRDTSENYGAIIGAASDLPYDNIYIYNKNIAGTSSSTSRADFAKIGSGGIIYWKAITQSTLNFEGSAKTTTGEYTTLCPYVDSSNNVYLFYSSQVSENFGATGLNYIAKFSSNMTSKLFDKPLSSPNSQGLSNIGLGAWYDTKTSTMLIGCRNGVIRVGLDGKIYSFYYGLFAPILGTIYGNTWCPYRFSPPPTDSAAMQIFAGMYSGYSNTMGVQDNSVIPNLSITTDSYTAILEYIGEVT